MVPSAQTKMGRPLAPRVAFCRNLNLTIFAPYGERGECCEMQRMLSLLYEYPDADKLFTMENRYRIQFPPSDSQDLGQDEIFFTLIEDGEAKRLRFHDYDEIYKRPGLYEQLFYERLGCNSPEKGFIRLKRI